MLDFIPIAEDCCIRNRQNVVELGNSDLLKAWRIREGLNTISKLLMKLNIKQ
jgi:hypothetical protein